MIELNIISLILVVQLTLILIACSVVKMYKSFDFKLGVNFVRVQVYPFDKDYDTRYRTNPQEAEVKNA
jgi:hypothetical protein